MSIAEWELYKYPTAACIGDRVGSTLPIKRINNELFLSVKDGIMIYITRGSRGFEAHCAKQLKKLKRKFPFISCLAVVSDSKQRVYGRKFYDEVIVLQNPAGLENFFLEYSDVFLCGNVADSKFLLFEAWQLGFRLREFGQIKDAEGKSFDEYFNEMSDLCDGQN